MGMPEESSYMGCASASPCPISCISLENPFFYSLPTSPTSNTANPNVSLLSQTEPTTPFTFDEEPTSSELDYFEFDISSGHFDLNTFETETGKTQNLSYDQKQVQIIERGESMPRSTTTMAFADELFSDGKVMPLLTTPPLKLPPRLQRGHHLKLPSKSPKLKTSRHILKNDDLDDPFLIALQNVTGESSRDRVFKNESKFRSLRRAWSFSSFWAYGPNHSTSLSNMGHSEFDQQVGSSTSTSLFDLLDLDHNNGKDRPQCPHGPTPGDQTTYVGSLSTKRLGWPKGVQTARTVGVVTVGNDEPNEPNCLSENGPTREIASEGTERRACLSESKRYKIKKFLLGDASVRKPREDNKQKDSTAALWKPSLLRKIGLKPVRSGRDNRVKRMYRMVRMTAIHYRPKLAFCWGGIGKM